MSEKIKPVLTADEWASARAGEAGGFVEVGDDLDLCFRSDGLHGLTGAETRGHTIPAPEKIVALANAALPDDDPRKITRGKLDALTEVFGAAALWSQQERKNGRDMDTCDRAVSAIARFVPALESYLPAEKP